VSPAIPHLVLLSPPAQASETPVLLQKDPRWRYIRLGKSTIGKIGCLTVLIGKKIYEDDPTRDPTSIFHLLATPKFVKPDGDLKWSALEAIFGIVVVDRFAASGNLVARVGVQLAQGYRVYLKLKKSSGGTHWVEAMQAKDGDLALSDPAQGHVYLLSFYGKPKRGSEVVVLQN
jgi:hypothetical protein